MTEGLPKSDVTQYLKNRLKDLLGADKNGKHLRTSDYQKVPLFPTYSRRSGDRKIKSSTYKAAGEIETMLDKISDLESSLEKN